MTQFTFLGFTFRPRFARSAKGVRFTSFLPAVSAEAAKRMRRQIRWWHLPRRTPATLSEIAADCDSTLTGWWNYYGSFYGSAMDKTFEHFDQALAYWVRRKFKSLRSHRVRSHQWVKRMARRESHLFVHWRNRHANEFNNGSRVTREGHARFCERLRGQFPRSTHELGFYRNMPKGVGSVAGLRIYFIEAPWQLGEVRFSSDGGVSPNNWRYRLSPRQMKFRRINGETQDD